MCDNEELIMTRGKSLNLFLMDDTPSGLICYVLEHTKASG